MNKKQNSSKKLVVKLHKTMYRLLKMQMKMQLVNDNNLTNRKNFYLEKKIDFIYIQIS